MGMTLKWKLHVLSLGFYKSINFLRLFLPYVFFFGLDCT